MPLYTFRNKETGEQVEKLISISNRETYLQDNPHLECVLTGAPNFGDPVRLGVRKPDGGFNEVLSKIAERSPMSNLTDKLSRK